MDDFDDLDEAWYRDDGTSESQYEYGDDTDDEAGCWNGEETAEYDDDEEDEEKESFLSAYRRLRWRPQGCWKLLPLAKKPEDLWETIISCRSALGCGGSLLGKQYYDHPATLLQCTITLLTAIQTLCQTHPEYVREHSTLDYTIFIIYCVLLPDFRGSKKEQRSLDKMAIATLDIACRTLGFVYRPLPKTCADSTSAPVESNFSKTSRDASTDVGESKSEDLGSPPLPVSSSVPHCGNVCGDDRAAVGESSLDAALVYMSSLTLEPKQVDKSGWAGPFGHCKAMLPQSWIYSLDDY